MKPPQGSGSRVVRIKYPVSPYGLDGKTIAVSIVGSIPRFMYVKYGDKWFDMISRKPYTYRNLVYVNPARNSFITNETGILYTQGVSLPATNIKHFDISSQSTDWTFSTGDGSLVNSDIVVAPNGYIFFTDDSYRLWCIDSGGNTIWTIDLSLINPNLSLLSSPALSYDNKTIYIGDDYGFVYAISIDGTIDWYYQDSNSADFTVGPPLVDYIDETIYFVGLPLDYNIYAFNPDGSLKWTSPSYYTIGGVLAQDKYGRLIASIQPTSTDTQNVCVVDRTNGSIIYSTQEGVFPCVFDRYIYSYTYSNILGCIDMYSKAYLWTRDYSATNSISGLAVDDEGNLLVRLDSISTTTNGGVAMVNPNDGTDVWTRYISIVAASSLFVSRTRVYWSYYVNQTGTFDAGVEILYKDGTVDLSFKPTPLQQVKILGVV